MARLQLRALLNATHDPAMDLLAPATFNTSSASVVINALWFASLALALAQLLSAFFVNNGCTSTSDMTTLRQKEVFLIRGLRYRGLPAWRVPEIIASFPILLQTALVLFLVGIPILLWPLQTVVTSIITARVGLTLFSWA